MDKKKENNGKENKFITGGIHTMEAFAELAKAVYLAACPEQRVETVRDADGALTGLALPDGNAIIPMVCLEGFYRKYREEGWSLMQAFGEIAKACEDYGTHRDALAGAVTDYGLAKNRVCYRLVDPKRNREFLESSPYIPWLDLAVAFYIPVAVQGGSGLSLPVDNALMEIWGIRDAEELYAAAHANTRRIFPGSIRYMADVFGDFAGSGDAGEREQVEIFMREGLEAPLYVATNAETLNGACVVLYDGLLREFADRVGDDLYLMGSSVHEMIAVPAMDAEPEGLRRIVQDINRLVVKDDEVLSDSIYYYDRERDAVAVL